MSCPNGIKIARDVSWLWLYGARHDLYIEYARAANQDDDSAKLIDEKLPLGLEWFQDEGNAYFNGSALQDHFINDFKIPFWLLTITILPVPVFRIVRRFHHGTAIGAVLCSRCGYDLRATPHRCPECGKIVENAL